MSDLRIKEIELADFRNYGNFRLNDVGSLTILVGRNGIGKTNVLEGIRLLSSGDSFKHAQISQMIREGRVSSRLHMRCEDGVRLVETTLSLEPGKKKFSVNGKPKALSDVKGMLPSVSFTPDDLELAKKSSGVKRTALDDMGSQLSSSYYIVARDYEKTIRYKNRLLKEEASPIMVESFNDTLVICGSQLYCYRVALFNKMLPLVEQYYREISNCGESFSALYSPSWDEASMQLGDPVRDQVKSKLRESLESHLEEERYRHRSIVGPHADKIVFMIGGRDASQFASQGQQRSIVLAWKLAEVEMTRRTLGTSPVLLLDDVMSELDGTRRDMLVNFVSDDIQTFLTATDLSGFNESLIERARVVELSLESGLK